MTKRMATMLIATAALGLAACSSSSKGGGTVTLPSISADSPTASATTSIADSSSPSSEPSSSSPSASATASPTTSASTSASPSASPSVLAGGACLSSHLSLSLGEGQGAAGSQITPLVFSNTGAGACTLSGYPGVSFVTGSSGSQVGAPAVRSGGGGSAVTLAANGTAQALIKMANTENYPAASCSPLAVRGFRVYPPGQKASLFVALPEGSMACSATNVMQLSVQTVTAG